MHAQHHNGNSFSTDPHTSWAGQRECVSILGQYEKRNKYHLSVAQGLLPLAIGQSSVGMHLDVLGILKCKCMNKEEKVAGGGGGRSGNLTGHRNRRESLNQQTLQLLVLGLYKYKNILTFLDHEKVADPGTYITILKYKISDFWYTRKERAQRDCYFQKEILFFHKTMILFALCF